MAASLPLSICLRAPVPSTWIRGFIQLTGLVRDGRRGKTLDPYPFSIVEPWIITSGRRLQLALDPREPMLRPHLSVGCLGLLRLETSEAMRVVSYYTGTMSCFNSRQPSEVAICAVPWLSDPVGFGSRRTWPRKKKSRAATLVAMVPVEVRYRGEPDGGGGSGQTQQHASRISSLEDDPWGPRYAQMHRRSGLRSIWIFDLAPAGMRAPLVRLTPATKSGSQYLPSWTRRSADVTVAARTSFVFGD